MKAPDTARGRHGLAGSLRAVWQLDHLALGVRLEQQPILRRQFRERNPGNRHVCVQLRQHCNDRAAYLEPQAQEQKEASPQTEHSQGQASKRLSPFAARNASSLTTSWPCHTARRGSGEQLLDE
jgi:hypothetical protein